MGEQSSDGIKVEIHTDAGRAVASEDAEWKKLASGFVWAEGPVYVPSLDCLLFSDVRANTMYKWSANTGLETFKKVNNQQRFR